MPELNFEDHSEEVQQILGQIPKWVIRWGITVLFIIAAVIFIGSRFIPYPEITNIPISITSQNAPAPLVAQQGSKRIAEWFKKDGDIVNDDDLLAVWEADDGYKEVFELERLMSSTEANSKISQSLKLPSFQSAIRDYNISLDGYSLLQSSDQYLLEIERLNEEIDRKKSSLSLLRQQQIVKEREFALLEKQFKQDSTYYYDGGYGITKRDYEAELLRFLQQKSAFIQYQSSLIDADQSIRDLESQIWSVRKERKSQLNSAVENLQQSRFALEESIKVWKLNNLLISPTVGKLDRSTFWSENQMISTGEVVAMVIPDDPAEILCRAYVDPASVAVLQEGQRVLIKLDGFSPQEFGSIEGKIHFISNVPYNEQYIVKVELINGLTTMENKEIPLIQELTGVAEVITSEGTLFERLIDFN